MRIRLYRLYEYFALYLALLMLGVACLLWSVLALILALLLPREQGKRFGRLGISTGFRLYLWALHECCACHFDLAELDQLRDAGPLVIAPNHPSLLDALMILSRLPDTACVLKAGLIDNVFLGAGARLAGFIRNDQFVGMARNAIAELRHGKQLLLFPEGTRTAGEVPNQFKGSVAIIACRAQVPVQLVIIEASSGFLGKGWPLFRRPDLPVYFRIRLGRRLQPGTDPARFTAELQECFAAGGAQENTLPLQCITPEASATAKGFVS